MEKEVVWVSENRAGACAKCKKMERLFAVGREGFAKGGGKAWHNRRRLNETAVLPT